jgi:alkaline phosphatase
MKLATTFILGSLAIANAQTRAKNVIIFFGDGVGLTSLNAASIHGHKEPQKLFLQSMPNIAWADSSSSSHWVTDAGAASTAVATGRKTDNRMVSVYRSADGKVEPAAKTLLDYAEERGLSTGGISDAAIANPLISAFFSRQEDRNDLADVFLQILSPRAGNGVDIVIGPGRKIISVMSGTNMAELSAKFKDKGYALASTIDVLKTPDGGRTVILTDTGDFDLQMAVEATIQQLSKNPKGFFLVVHADCHLKDKKKSLDRLLELDRVVKSVVEQNRKDTLVLVTADHSYGIRLEGQKTPKPADVLTQVTLLDDHTGEDVPVLASGPGSERVRGFVPNTRIFDWVVEAYGWTGVKLSSR